MDRTEAVTLMEKRREAWLRQDLDAYLSLFSDDFVFSDGTGQSHGRASWEELNRRNAERVLPVSWEFHELAVHGSNILAEWTLTLEPRGTGTRVSLKAMSISETRDGLFAANREYRWPIG